MSEIEPDRIVAALREEWTSIDELASGLGDDQWKLAAPLPGWTVRDTFIHVFATEAMLLGRQPTVEVDADGIDHVRNPIGAMNEAWIASYANASTDELLTEFRGLTGERLDALEAMTPEQWAELGPTPVGQAPYGRFMQIRVFDCWMHEQDIRRAVGTAGHESGLAVEVVLDEMAAAMGFVVGKKAGAPAGASVTFDLTGEAARQIHVEVGERAKVVVSLAGPATTTLSMPAVSFSRIAGGRDDADTARAGVTISGDDALGQAVLDSLAYTI